MGRIIGRVRPFRSKSSGATEKRSQGVELRNVKISAFGCYVPPGVLTNQDLEKMVDTTDQWILERTGIHERHISAPEVATSDMAVEAAKLATRRVRQHRGAPSPAVVVIVKRRRVAAPT